MYAIVAADQFSLVDGSVIHLPTGAEFTPTSKTAESILVWTGAIERPTSDGLVFSYQDVLVGMKAYWLGYAAKPLAAVA